MNEENSKKVARVVVEKLVASGLVPAENTERIEAAIASGRMTQEDWRLELEKALAIEVKS